MPALKGSLKVKYNGSYQVMHPETEVSEITDLDTHLAGRVLRQTEAEFETADAVIGAGVVALSTDKNAVKIGDGTTTWSNLEYINNSQGVSLQVFSNGEYVDL